MENQAEKFLERYREIEEWVINNLKIPEMKDLESMPKYKNIRSNLSFCRYLRNLLSHHDWSKGGEDLIIVTERAVRQVNSLYYSLNPVTLMRVAVSRANIYAPNLQDSVLETAKVMVRNDYSYAPIIENQIVKGVFSAKSLMGFFTDSESLRFDKNLIFKDIEKYISISSSEPKKFGFISVDAALEDASLMFQSGKNNRKRVDLLLITDDGTAAGKLVGMITPADIVGL